jgi:hypothetical protein
LTSPAALRRSTQVRPLSDEAHPIAPRTVAWMTAAVLPAGLPIEYTERGAGFTDVGRCRQSRDVGRNATALEAGAARWMWKRRERWRQ